MKNNVFDATGMNKNIRERRLIHPKTNALSVIKGRKFKITLPYRGIKVFIKTGSPAGFQTLRITLKNHPLFPIISP